MEFCEHVQSMRVVKPHDVAVFEECLKTGSWWVHLRSCLSCGQVGCCDDSPNKHATKHFKSSGHPVMRSLEPGEDWAWCYVDQLVMEPAPRPND